MVIRKKKPVRRIEINKYLPIPVLFVMDLTTGRACMSFSKVLDNGKDFNVVLPKKASMRVILNEFLEKPTTRILPYFDRLQELWCQYEKNELKLSYAECKFFAEKNRDKSCKDYKVMLQCFNKFFNSTLAYGAQET